MTPDLSNLEPRDELTIESAQPFPTTVRVVKHDDEGELVVKTGNSLEGQELREENGHVVLYRGLEKTRVGPVNLSRREEDLPVTELQEDILWYAHDAERGVHPNRVVSKFGVSEQEAHEACMALGERDLLSYWTHRGYWSIYEEGEDWLAEHSEPPVEPYPHKHNLAADDGSRLNTYAFIKEMQWYEENADNGYNGDLIGFDPDDPNIAV